MTRYFATVDLLVAVSDRKGAVSRVQVGPGLTATVPQWQATVFDADAAPAIVQVSSRNTSAVTDAPSRPPSTTSPVVCTPASTRVWATSVAIRKQMPEISRPWV